MPEEFACPKCDSPSVVYSNDAEDDNRVVCRACGTLLATRAQFRRFVERHAKRSGLCTSGC
jgi:transcription elongation factor Elf1